jgi:PKD repeat protein
MKSIINRSLKILFVLCGVVGTLPSCTYKKIMDANYPAQMVYMPAAVSQLVIDNTPKPTLADPTPGNPYNFIADLTFKEIRIPLGVYRSGIDNKGVVSVNIAANNDTITKLLAIPGKLPVGTVLLNSDKYTLPTSISLEDGQEVGTFNLNVNMDSLTKVAPNRIYAVAVGISGETVNPKLNTTIIVINTKMMIPAAAFSYTVDANNAKSFKFNNTSAYATSYIWDYGDGSPVSNDVSPTHIYSNTAQYTVTLTAIGVNGNKSQSIQIINKPTLGTILVEAESSSVTRAGFTTEANTFASGGSVVKNAVANTTASASFKFTGYAGVPDIKVTYFDENDGVDNYRLYVAGVLVDSWSSNADLGSPNPIASTLTSRTKTGVSISYGDVIRLEVDHFTGTDDARIDKFELIQH